MPTLKGCGTCISVGSAISLIALFFVGFGFGLLATFNASFNNKFHKTQCLYLRAVRDKNPDITIPAFLTKSGAIGYPFLRCDNGNICDPKTCCVGTCKKCRTCTSRFRNVICTNFNGSSTQKIGDYPWNNGQYRSGVWYDCYETKSVIPRMAKAPGCHTWIDGCVMMERKKARYMGEAKFWGVMVGVFFVPSIMACIGIVIGAVLVWWGTKAPKYPPLLWEL